jgi:hypothetical protein
MKELIEGVINVSKSSKLTCNQALFLIACNNNIFNIDIPSEELLELIQRGYIKNNSLTELGINVLTKKINKTKENEKILNNLYPILTEDTGEITKRLAKHFLGNRLTAEEFSKISDYTSNQIMIPFIFIFLEMFPTANKTKNVAWNKHFDTTWDNVTLRRISNGTVRSLEKIWKKKDIGLFLLGTYLFIKGSYNESSGKYFIKNIENYLEEHDHWYNEANDLLISGNLEQFTKKEVAKSQSNNTTVI